MSAPRVVCLGANEESAVVLRGLIDHGVSVVGVVTVPTRTVSRSSDYADLAGLATEAGAALIYTHDINDSDTIAAMAALSADRLFILGWSQLVRQPVLDAFVSGVVGSHPSPLPSGRGRAPLPWTILEGRTRNAVTLFELSLGVDSGGILAQRWYDVPERATARDLYDINAAALRDAFIDVHDAIRDDILDPVAQDETQASYRGKRIPADGLIDFAWSAGEIDRLVRAVSTPYPGAYSYVEGYRVVFWASEPSDTRNRKGQPGQILARRGEDVLVQAGAGDAIWLCEPQIADAAGEQVDPRSVLRVGQCLGYRMQDEIHALRERIARLEAILTERGDA